MKQSIVVFLCGILLLVWGLILQNSTKAWTEQRTRAITVIDAYEHYDEYGNRSLKGIALDKKLNHEFVVSLSSQQFQKFMSDRKPLTNLEIKTTLQKMAYPGVPHGKLFGGIFFAIVGVLSMIGSVIGFFVCLAIYLEEKKRELHRRTLERRYGW
ncbi:hypothetical protein NoPa_00129 [Pseudomonas phage vB_PpuM-NoPa]|uniref:ABC transporter permease n=1 Tax=Pseudomonas phage vB_PpuM-NoPa TaxID=3132619 RepID=A0AAX4MZA5_9CAUD